MGIGQKRVIESFMESEEAKPHSTREGRIAAGQRRIERPLKSRRKKSLREQLGKPKYKDQVEKKWIARPGKRILKGKQTRGGGHKPIINPKWLENKYDVTIERRHGGRATHGYGKAYMKGGKVK